MNEVEAYRAVKDGLTARAKWGGLADGSGGDIRLEGRVTAYSQHPMVLIVSEDGERVWWRADMCDVEQEMAP